MGIVTFSDNRYQFILAYQVPMNVSVYVSDLG